MNIKSKALEVNIATYRVDVTIDPRLGVIEEVMSKYYGLLEGVKAFLEELSHPYKNWQFIVREARGYCLDYIHLLKTHERGPDAARLYVDIFIEAIESAPHETVKIDATDNLLLFIQKFIVEASSDLKNSLPVLAYAFERIHQFPDHHFILFVNSFYQLNRIAGRLFHQSENIAAGYGPLNRLLYRYIQETYTYWRNQTDPLEWFVNEIGEIDQNWEMEAPLKKELALIFKNISVEKIIQQQKHLKEITATVDMDSRKTLASLLELPGYGQFVDIYAKIPQQLLRAGGQNGMGKKWKLIFLFHILNLSGLKVIHEETLRDINRTLSWIIANENPSIIRQLIRKTFSIINDRIDAFPGTALNCVLNMGQGVYQIDDSELVNFFIDALIAQGFQAPMIQGVGNDWQIKVNGAHLQNIRTWLRLIEKNPRLSIRLLSALIIHLSVSGVFIKDTDLFSRDITNLLNSEIEPVYNLIKQLCKLFPAFFNDIGAEGHLRDISTELDELCNRKDVLIHFLRKQCHVESSNRIIGFIEAVFTFWQTKQKKILEPFLPPNIFDQIEPKGNYIDGVNRVMAEVADKVIQFPKDLLTIEPEMIADWMPPQSSSVSSMDIKRVKMIIAFYKLLNQKYCLEFNDIESYLDSLQAVSFPEIGELRKAIKEPDLIDRIAAILSYLDKLKALLTSPKNFDIREDIYKKRHITVDIPSMYGSYHETKFDALGLTFRIEALVNALFEEIVDRIDLKLITKKTVEQILLYLKLFNKALILDGIWSVEWERQLDLLEHSLTIRGFSFTQYLDIFKGFAQSVKNIITDHFNNIHEQNLNIILSNLSADQILKKYLPTQAIDDLEKLKHRVSEIFFREKLSFSLGLQQLDVFISRILKVLFHQAGTLSREKLHLLLTYEPDNAISSLDESTSHPYGIIRLGNKGLNIAKLKRLGWPVPPGFIITTEIFRCRELIESYPPAQTNFQKQIVAHVAKLEKATGKVFGDPMNPLLLSVRSGSSISQPGMMDTFLNVGMTSEIAHGLAKKTGNPWFAWDSYRRFLQSYGMSFGLDRNAFDAIINAYKQKWSIAYKCDFSGDQMKKITIAYKEMIQQSNVTIVESPIEQLYVAIRKVFASWFTPKAQTYRIIMGISDDWGTAATVQAMVFGNRSKQSGSGVLFSHSPKLSGDVLRLWGDFSVESQGEDVVSGLVTTLPISEMQKEIEQRDTSISLEKNFPDIYLALKEWVNRLIYKEGWSPQEIEFTFESPWRKDLYILQTRDMAMRERKEVVTFDLADLLKATTFLGHGIGVSGGAMSGRIVFSLEDIDYWRQKEPKTALILLRSDTVPDDIRETHAADGLLTARGGLTSHAAVVAHRLGKTCVVGCTNLICNEVEKTCRFDNIDLKMGEHISIDGREGSVYQGLLALKKN